MDKELLSLKRKAAGQKGGRATRQKYGIVYLRRLGQSGGRPSNPTLTAIKQRITAEITELKKEE